MNQKRILYFDASALLRILLQEKGESPNLISGMSYSSQIIEIEVFKSLERAMLSSRFTTSEFARKCNEAGVLLSFLNRLPCSAEVIKQAQTPSPIPTRALDAIHVATAKLIQDELGISVEFWTHDRRQADTAIHLGLEVKGL